MIRIPVFFILLFATVSAASQTASEISDTVFALIYRQKYDDAEKLLHQNKDHIDSLYFAVLEIDLCYWKNVSGTPTPNYAAFENLLKSYAFEDSPDEKQKAIRLVRLSYQLRYELKRFRLFSAISTRKKTIQLFNTLKAHSNQLDQNQQELFELYQALITYFDAYLKPFFAKDKKAQTDILAQTMDRLTASDQRMVKTLSSYFLGKIYLKYEKEPEKARPYLQRLQTNYPENQTFQKLLSECKS